MVRNIYRNKCGVVMILFLAGDQKKIKKGRRKDDAFCFLSSEQKLFAQQ